MLQNHSSRAFLILLSVFVPEYPSRVSSDPLQIPSLGLPPYLGVASGFRNDLFPHWSPLPELVQVLFPQSPAQSGTGACLFNCPHHMDGGTFRGVPYAALICICVPFRGAQ